MAVTAAPSTGTRILRRTPSPPALAEADICVVGAGISGISAAVESARLGRRVVLVDAQPSLGGQAVNSIIGTFAGLYSNGANGFQLTRGIADDILRDLGQRGGLHTRHGPPHTTVLYDEVMLSRWVEETVRASGIRVLLGAVIREVAVAGGRITSVEFATRYGEVRVAAEGFVDATGDAALAWMAGFPCREPEEVVYGSQMVVLENVNEAAMPSRAELAARQWQKAPEYGMVRRDGFAFLFAGRGVALVNMTHVETPLEPFAASAVALEGKAQADRAVAFLRAEYPDAFAGARVRAYGQPGIRQTRWIKGRHHLTVEEVRAGTRFPDAVARTAWAIELHTHAEGYIWEPFPPEHLHYVPFGSMVPEEARNLVVAGRCIDADTAALSSVRVMGPCIAMGYAAAHALDLAGSGSVQQIDMAAFAARVAPNVTEEGPRACG
jgi:2-polyprenyl-6-methoxyphenol hydroxylase-like FAD-dependent oxidoreductase